MTHSKQRAAFEIVARIIAVAVEPPSQWPPASVAPQLHHAIAVFEPWRLLTPPAVSGWPRPNVFCLSAMSSCCARNARSFRSTRRPPKLQRDSRSPGYLPQFSVFAQAVAKTKIRCAGAPRGIGHPTIFFPPPGVKFDRAWRCPAFPLLGKPDIGPTSQNYRV
jgi:hypothetical protein